ncbi:MAG: aldehyde ferredoxin oxidoreductase family protein [Chloroflexi bacterium]|nr:aldehyde ferredoxin oxidoreductase family protein [Chloroflexota bacterium]
MLYGYGKILEVDLATKEIVRRRVDAQFAQQYIGGMGFSSRILFDEVGPEVDPLGPDNIVVFANGPLTGTHAPCSGRTEITTRSPLTGSIGTGNTGGIWGALLKHAGFDLIVVRRQAERPVYLWINDDVVEIRDASHLWGKDTWETSDMLRQELASSSKSGVSVLAIGPAGENLVKYACPLNDYYHVASRSGSGAVMGAMKLKGIAVRGTGTVSIARPKEFQEAVKEARERLLTADGARKMPGGPPEARRESLERGSLPARNYQTGVLPGWLETRGQDVARKYVTGQDGTCYACPIPCFNVVEVKEGKYAGLKENRGLMPGVVYHWGAKCAIETLPAIWRCKELCQHLGMDYGSASGSISFGMELFQRGIITTRDTDGLELGWGNEDAVIKMLHKIAHREGFGDILAEGSVRAAEKIGRGAEQYVMAIKGMEMMIPDPRSGNRGWVFGSLTNPRGGDSVKNTHTHAEVHNPNWGVDKFDMFDDVKARIYNAPPQEVPHTWEGKPAMCKWFEDLYSAINSLGLCFFTAGSCIAFGPTYLSKLFAACTGRDTSPEDIMKAGERVLTLLKAYIVRDGLTKKDDCWPDRFYEEPLPEGGAKGAVLSRETMDRLLEEYYALRGWERETGLPTARKLTELGLGDIANELVQRGKLRAN